MDHRIARWRRIAGPNYFGLTAAAKGDMVGFVRKTSAAAESEHARKKLVSQTQAIAAALSAEAARPDEADLAARDRPRISEGYRLMKEAFGCTDCHRVRDQGELGSAPDLTGYGSHAWLRGMISDPNHERFYGNKRNDRMPAFLKFDDPNGNLLSTRIGICWSTGCGGSGTNPKKVEKVDVRLKRRRPAPPPENHRPACPVITWFHVAVNEPLRAARSTAAQRKPPVPQTSEMFRAPSDSDCRRVSSHAIRRITGTLLRTRQPRTAAPWRRQLQCRHVGVILAVRGSSFAFCRSRGRLACRSCRLWRSSLLLLATIAVAARTLNHLQVEAERAIDQAFTAAEAAERLELVFQECRSHLSDYAITGRPSEIEQAKHFDKENAERLLQIDTLEVSSRGHLLIAELRRYTIAFEHAPSTKSPRPHRSQLGDEIVERVISTMLDPQILSRAREERELCLQTLHAARMRGAQATSRAGWALLVLGLVGVVGGTLAGFGIARSLRRELIELSIPIHSAIGSLDEVVGPVRVFSTDNFKGLDAVLDSIAQRVAQVIERLQKAERERLRNDQMAALGQLAAGLAHELRNPLTAMKTIVDSVRRGGPAHSLDDRDSGRPQGGDHCAWTARCSPFWTTRGRPASPSVPSTWGPSPKKPGNCSPAVPSSSRFTFRSNSRRVAS